MKAMEDIVLQTPKKRYIFDLDCYDEEFWRDYCEEDDPGEFDWDAMGLVAERAMLDLDEEIAKLTVYLNGDDGKRFRGLMGSTQSLDCGNRLAARGSIGRWDGTRTGMTVFEGFDELLFGVHSPFRDCRLEQIWDENGSLFIYGTHHDGSVTVEVRQFTDAAETVFGEMSEGHLLDDVVLSGETFSPGNEGDMLRFMWDDASYCRRPRYMELSFGCPALEWEDPDKAPMITASFTSSSMGSVSSW